MERSSDQVIKPVNLDALSKWVGHIPEDVVSDMAKIAPMLSVLNYDPFANPPDYGKPDAWVEDNTIKVCAASNHVCFPKSSVCVVHLRFVAFHFILYVCI